MILLQTVSESWFCISQGSAVTLLDVVDTHAKFPQESVYQALLKFLWSYQNKIWNIFLRCSVNMYKLNTEVLDMLSLFICNINRI